MTQAARKQNPEDSERLKLLKCWTDLLFRPKKVHDRYLGTVKLIEKFSILSWEICHGFAPSASDLASELELHRETVRRLLEELVEKGLLNSQKRGKKMICVLLPAGECVVVGVFDELIDVAVEIRRSHGLRTDYIERMLDASL